MAAQDMQTQAYQAQFDEIMESIEANQAINPVFIGNDENNNVNFFGNVIPESQEVDLQPLPDAMGAFIDEWIRNNIKEEPEVEELQPLDFW